MTKKFNVWDSETIKSTLSQLLQIRSKIEEMIASSEQEIGPEHLPPSVIQTSLLYNLSVCYEVIYDKLQEHQLIKIGSPKSTNGIH